MKFDDLTIGDAKKLVAIFAAAPDMPSTIESFGHAIVVVDRGFVYVGIAMRTGDLLRMAAARNIRMWGTTAGLAELVNSGPTKNTRLDGEHDLVIPMRAVISIHPSDVALWKK